MNTVYIDALTPNPGSIESRMELELPLLSFYE